MNTVTTRNSLITLIATMSFTVEFIKQIEAYFNSVIKTPQVNDVIDLYKNLVQVHTITDNEIIIILLTHIIELADLNIDTAYSSPNKEVSYIYAEKARCYVRMASRIALCVNAGGANIELVHSIIHYYAHNIRIALPSPFAD